MLVALRPMLQAETNRFSYLDNGEIKIGVDLETGGSIGYMANSGSGSNIVNIHDLGRWIGQSYYSGPKPFGKAHAGWKAWPWNPVSAGDVAGHMSKILTYTNDGKTLYVKSTPMQWALDNVPGDCTFETWITLENRTAHVRNRLTNLRSDHLSYPGMNQELPALYTVGKLYRLFTYDGDHPFTGDTLRKVPHLKLAPGQFPWTHFSATENWAALVNDEDWGLGLFHPGVIPFLGGFSGLENSGGPKDSPTGYLAPGCLEILDHNIVYEYEYVLILDTLKSIRRYVYEHRPSPLPDFRFNSNRQHWHYGNAEDSGFPWRDRLHVKLEKNDPYLISPEVFWDAQDVPRLYIRAAYHTHHTQGELFWLIKGMSNFDDKHRISFPIKLDGAFHTYEINLAGSPEYQGKITKLRFDPVPEGAPGDYVEIEFISRKRE